MQFMTEEKMHELANIIGHLTRQPVGHSGLLTTTVVNTWYVWATVVILCFLATRKLSDDKPGKIQILLEMLVEFIYGLLEPAMGRHGRKYVWLVGGLFVSILSLNFAWFWPGMIPPVTDFSTTAALAVVTILTIQVLGIRTVGIGKFLGHFANPMNLLEQVTRPFSLAVRLFGNMFGEKMVVTVLFILAPLFFPTPVMLLGVLMGFIQAFVFSLLSTTYLSEMVHHH
ncbi:MAG: F0F1 ATP synthase subunit A [Chitinophagales bacterium]